MRYKKNHLKTEKVLKNNFSFFRNQVFKNIQSTIQV